MVCKNCGAEIADGSAFCTECGAPVQQESKIQEYAYEATPVQTSASSSTPSTTTILILGIVSVVVPFIGALVCGIICLKKVKAYTDAGGIMTGKVKVGKILGMIGLIYGIASCAIAITYLIFAVIWAFIVAGIYQSGISPNNMLFNNSLL